MKDPEDKLRRYGLKKLLLLCHVHLLCIPVHHIELQVFQFTNYCDMGIPSATNREKIFLNRDFDCHDYQMSAPYDKYIIRLYCIAVLIFLHSSTRVYVSSQNLE